MVVEVNLVLTINRSRLDFGKEHKADLASWSLLRERSILELVVPVVSVLTCLFKVPKAVVLVRRFLVSLSLGRTCSSPRVRVGLRCPKCDVLVERIFEVLVDVIDKEVER